MSIAYRRLSEKSAALQKEEAQLEQQIEKAKDKKQELKDKKEYIKTKEFIEKTARVKFGLFYPDEYVVRPSNWWIQKEVWHGCQAFFFVINSLFLFPLQAEIYELSSKIPFTYNV